MTIVSMPLDGAPIAAQIVEPNVVVCPLSRGQNTVGKGRPGGIPAGVVPCVLLCSIAFVPLQEAEG